jgi:hypothetical protein
MARKALVVGLVALGVAGSAVAAPSVSDQARPALGVADTSPFVIRGRGFEARERVHVLLAVNGRQLTRSTVAARDGTFRVEFQVSLGRCGRYSARAFGSKGSSARIWQRHVPACVGPSGGGSHT